MSPIHSNKVHLKFDQSILARLPLDGDSLAIGQMHIATEWVLPATRQIHTATGQDRKYTELNQWGSG